MGAGAFQPSRFARLWEAKTVPMTSATVDMILMKISRQGADSVLERVAHGVADDGGVVLGAALASTFDRARFDGLLAVVPGAAGVAGEDGDHDGTDRGADDHAANKLRSEDEAAGYGNDDRKQRRDLHLADRSLGGYLNAGLVVGQDLAFEKPQDLAELAADLIDHLARSRRRRDP